MRKNETGAPARALREGLERAEARLGDFPETRARVAQLAQLLLRAIDMPHLTLHHLLEAVTTA